MASPSAYNPDLERRKVESLTVELLTAYEELSLLYSLGGQIGRLLDRESIGAAALREAIEVLHADCGWIVLWNADGSSIIPESCCAGVPAAAAEQVSRRLLDRLRSRGKTQALLHSLEQEWNVAAPENAVRLLACELSAGDAPVGFISLGRRRDSPIFDSADQKLIHAIAALTGVTLEHLRLQADELEKQRLEREMDLAREIQRSLLPRDFCCSNFLEASGVSVPCYEIGGDYFDLIAIDRDQCLLAIADVSGKGPAAALRAAMLQGIVHAVSLGSRDLPHLLYISNQCLRERTTDSSFVTAFMATLSRSGELHYTNAGHNPPIWIQADGRITELTASGVPLGILPNPSYAHSGVSLSPGDLVVLYTDGVTDTENHQGETIGTQRILNWAATQAGRGATAVKDSLVETLGRFCEGCTRPDDLTLLVVCYTGEPC
jgi:serine phosphatase RsbU (regulator of sigma subunit)